MIIAIDFDGTISTGRYPAIDGLREGAKEAIMSLHIDKHFIIINTCRSGQQLLDAINFMLFEGIWIDRVNDNHPDESAKYNNNSRKIFAHVYIDDKQIGGLPPWESIYDYVTEIQRQWDEKKKP